jgi:hypothetical protein
MKVGDWELRMTVEEMIQKLQQLNPNLEVVTDDFSEITDILVHDMFRCRNLPMSRITRNVDYNGNRVDYT